MLCADSDKEFDHPWIRRRWLMDKMKNSVQPKHPEYQSQELSRNDSNDLHATTPWRLRACFWTA
jgi:hypothetical protein